MHSGDFLWTRSVAGLGFRDGISRKGLDETIEAYFRLPPPLRAGRGRLTVVLESLMPPGAQGRAEIALDGHSRASLQLRGGLRRFTTALDVEPALLADGHVKLAVHFSGALRADRCIDERLGGFSLTLLPESALAFAVGREVFVRADNAWPLLPERISIVLPPPPLAPTEYETALKLAVALARWGHDISFVAAQAAAMPGSGMILLKRGNNADKTMTAALQNGVPVLTVAADGEGSEQSQYLMRWLQGPAPPLPRLDAPIPLQTLGGEAGLRFAAPKAEWSLPLSLGRMPAGAVPDSLSLVLAAPADVEASAHLLNVFIDGTLIASRRLRPQGTTHRATIPLGTAALSVDSRALVVFERIDAAPACLGPHRASPVALLPESALVLRKAAKVHDFATLVPRFARGVEFYLPQHFLDVPQNTLPFVTAVVRDFVRAPWRAKLRFSAEGHAPTPDSPFIAIGPDPPRDASLPLSLDRGAISIVDRTDRELVRLEDSAADTLAQVVDVHGEAGLWIRPNLASLPAAPQVTALARGNVALIDHDGVALWFDTHAERGLIVRYADSSLLASHVAHFWAWIVAGVWLLLTIAVLYGARTRRKDDS